jgi:hypothetical protein
MGGNAATNLTSLSSRLNSRRLRWMTVSLSPSNSISRYGTVYVHTSVSDPDLGGVKSTETEWETRSQATD